MLGRLRVLTVLPTYDVVVAGGGPAGAATARRLARAGYAVAVVERSQFDRPRVGETLAPGIQPLLLDLDVWEQFRALHPLPSWGTRSIWSGPEPAEHSHLASGYDSGWHVDRRTFDRMLLDAAADAGASVSLGTSLTSCRYDAGRWRIACSDDRILTSRFVVDATGRSASIGRTLGAHRHAFDRLVGITADWQDVDVTNENYLLIESVSNGWWYTAPLPGNRMVGMLMTDADICRHHNLSSSTTWYADLRSTTATAARLHATSAARQLLATAPRVYSAASHRLVRHDDSRPWLAVGDAALAVDPISGSGVPRALRTAEAAAETIAAHLHHPDNPTPLANYESTRNTECTNYLTTRAAYYAAATPHPTPFWTRRKLPTLRLTPTDPATPPSRG